MSSTPSAMIESTPTWPGPDHTVFNPFNIHEITYKTLTPTHDLKAALLIPKTLPKDKKPHPVIINMHGGFLTMGHALFGPFFAPWIASLALSNNAIVLSIDYRLLPTPRGVLDPLQDLDDFWKWFKSDFAGVLARLDRSGAMEADFSRVMLIGGSAGGYCVVQTALSYPDEISAVAMLYPLVDLKDDMFVRGPAGGKTVFGMPEESFMGLEEAVAWVEGEKEKEGWKSRAGFEVSQYNFALTQRGRLYEEVFNPTGCEEAKIFPLERMRGGAKAPGFIWVLTGVDDSTIRVESVRDTVALMKEKLPGTEVRYDEAPGQEHGFDLLNPEWEQYAVGSLDKLQRAWLLK
ncbi:unnamed protein product [Periconia digitata]|uniref:Alpha/beta hydrolase fold-3 domain-containing protein n=1 Tax=Periconia digitata TaxID=1303443 RepID=A0A9W4UTE2_9PLEO|nr:unnamed protein product [Periconia digitata]